MIKQITPQLWLKRRSVIRVVGTLGVLVAASAVFAQPSAIEPLPRPWFSIDLESPTVMEFDEIGADDVLAVENDGVSPPMVTFDGVGLGLGLTGDDLDGLSMPDSSLSGSSLLPTTFALLFSVDRNSVGAVDPLFEAYPFNVKQQAALGQAAGDEYLALLLFDSGGAVTTSQSNNVLVGNQDDVGGVDGASLELLPLADPFTSVVGQNQDGLDAVLRIASGSTGLGPAPFFFSLTSASPSLPSLPGESSGADIYADPDPTVADNELKYATPDDLGLIDDDDIDAVHVFDDGGLVFDSAVDQILLSLAPGSPSLILLGAGPADILTTVDTFGDPPLVIYATALDLGLCPEDNVTAIDAYPATDLIDLLCRAGIRGGPTGDANGDCVIDPLDSGFVQARYGCTVGGGDPSCRAADQNGDGVVDPLDAGFVLARLGLPVLGDGACCTIEGTCEVQPAADCIRDDGLYRGDGTLCEAGACIIVPDCPSAARLAP